MNLRTWLIVFGIALLAAGLLWPWLQRIGLGRLPGDIVIERERVRIYIPLASSILVSVIVTLILWFFRK